MKFKMYLSGAFVAALLSGFVLGGCSKDEDDPDQGKKAKITISVSDAFSKAEGDHFQFGVGASDSKGASVDWKINGETEKGTVIFITDEDVDGGKSDIVVESVQQFMIGSVSIATFNIDGSPYTISYKIEVDGNVVDEQSYEFAAGSDSFTKNYQL